MAKAEQLSELYTREQLSFCEQLPKIELHAHLNGSIRDSTIRELAVAKDLDPETVKLTSKGSRTLAECFKLFDVIHRVVTDAATVTRITEEVLEDFAKDSVVYLELRTTPKHRPEHGITKRSYAEAVLAGIDSFSRGKAPEVNHLEQDNTPLWGVQSFLRQCSTVGDHQMTVRLLLSIDRREDEKAALETVELAAELAPKGVVGIDLSGNPTIGSWESWEGPLQAARKHGLKVTLHAGETNNFEETASMLRFEPDRLGHMCFLNDALEEALRTSRVPLELCLSSNVITESVKGYPDHHFLPLFQAGHPVVLCTDDSGVFATRLSREYAIAAAAFNLDPVALLALAESAVEYCFLDAAEKENLRSRFEGFRTRRPDVGARRLDHVPLEPVLDTLHSPGAVHADAAV